MCAEFEIQMLKGGLIKINETSEAVKVELSLSEYRLKKFVEQKSSD